MERAIRTGFLRQPLDQIGFSRLFRKFQASVILNIYDVKLPRPHRTIVRLPLNNGKTQFFPQMRVFQKRPYMTPQTRQKTVGPTVTVLQNTGNTMFAQQRYPGIRRFAAGKYATEKRY